MVVGRGGHHGHCGENVNKERPYRKVKVSHSNLGKSRVGSINDILIVLIGTFCEVVVRNRLI